MFGDELLNVFSKHIYITHPAGRFSSVASGFALHVFLESSELHCIFKSSCYSSLIHNYCNIAT
jgi:hypothetical protein